MRPWTNPCILLLALAASCANTGRASDLAKEFVARNYPGQALNGEPSCEWHDSDDDGRLRCTVSVSPPGDPARTTVQTLDCPSYWFVGCASQCVVTSK